MDNLILSPVPIKDLIEQIREVVRAEVKSERQKEIGEKLLSPAEACKLFKPNISKVSLGKWTANGLIPMQKIGGRVFYKTSDILEAGTKLKKYKRA